jgi:hypothetical protein
MNVNDPSDDTNAIDDNVDLFADVEGAVSAAVHVVVIVVVVIIIFVIVIVVIVIAALVAIAIIAAIITVASVTSIFIATIIVAGNPTGIIIATVVEIRSRDWRIAVSDGFIITVTATVGLCEGGVTRERVGVGGTGYPRYDRRRLR